MLGLDLVRGVDRRNGAAGDERRTRRVRVNELTVLGAQLVGRQRLMQGREAVVAGNEQRSERRNRAKPG
jgi:hypothetical protein